MNQSRPTGCRVQRRPVDAAIRTRRLSGRGLMTSEIVRRAVDGGYRLVDTAAAYRNEDGVGEALDGRTDIFVTTKLWNADHGFDEALRAFEESARKLRRHTLDLYLIHWPRPRFNRYVQSWKALVRLQSEGRIRSIGVSNFNRDHLERIIGETGVTPAVNQIELHPRFQQKALRAFHFDHGIRTESASSAGSRAFAERSRHRRHCRQAWENAGASSDPLASRIRPDRHSQNGEGRTLRGKHRRARLPSR